MTQPLDMMTAAQDAVVALLQAQLPADQRGMVRHTLMRDTQPPFHLVGDIVSENAGSKTDQNEDILVDVHTVYKGTDRRELLALMHQVRVAADDQSLEQGGVLFRITWLTGDADGFASDGVHCAGVTTLHLSAEPA